ncbi:MAG: CHAT domain-containing protein [Tenuifilaceae bacterium]|nr:CHAT domain-containing protein [Tenuifilaceae bacterium]
MRSLLTTLSLLLLFISINFISYAQYGPFYSVDRELRSYSHYNSYIEIVKKYNINRDISEALVQIDSLAIQAQNQGDLRQFLFLKNEVSNFYKFGNQFSEGYSDLYNAMQAFAAHSDTIDIEYAVSLRLLRGLLTRSNHTSRGEEEMLASQLAILDSLGVDGEPMTNTLVDYGLFLNRRGKTDEAIEMLYQARNTALHNNDLMSLAVADMSLISNTDGIDLEQTVIEVLQNDLSLLNKAPRNIPTLVYTSFFNYMLGNRHYWNIKDIEKSIEYNLRTTQCLDTLQYPMWNLKSSSHSLLAQAYSDLNDTVAFWHHYHIAKDVAGSQPMSDYNRGLAYITLVEAAINIAPDSAQRVIDILENHKAADFFQERISRNQALIHLRQNQFSQAVDIINAQFDKHNQVGNHALPSLSDSLDPNVQLEFFKILNTIYLKLDKVENKALYKGLISDIIFKKNELYKRIVQNEVFGLEISSIIAEYNRFVNQSLSYLLNNYNPSTDQELVAQLFFSSKAIQLNNNLGKSILQGQLESNSHQFSELLHTVSEVNRVKTQLTNMNLSSNERDSLNKALNFSLIESLITKHRVSRKLDTNLQSISIPTVAELQSLLNPQQGLIEFCHNDSTLSWIFITNNSLRVGQKRVEELNKMISREIYEVKTGGSTSGLGEVLFCHSIMAEIDELNSLVVIPSNELVQIPFEWLKPPSSSKMIIETHTVTYSYSSSLWYRSKLNAQELTTPSLLTVAPFTMDNIWETTQFASDYRGSIPLPPLYASKEEVDRINELYKQHNTVSVSIVGEQATEKNVEHQLGNFDILHLATHGLTNKNNPERSGLFLYPNQHHNINKTFYEEGFLSLAKLQNLKLNANLAVLSACNTGTGTIAEGEGIMALPRGFIFAGVPNVIASLWKVHDERTKDLMIAFYEHLLNGNSYADALRLAKLDCIGKGYLPIDWAGFVLIGT